MMMGDGNGWWILMWVWMALFWTALIGGAVWFFGSLRPGGGGSGALEVLRGRLAAGEIDVDEFRRREAALGTSGDGQARPVRLLILAGVIAVAVLVVIPAAFMFSNGWDWNMHGRGRNTSTSPVVQGGSEANVRIEDFAFQPGNLEVAAGASVTWTNEDSAAHDATSRSGDWNTERLSDGESATLTFESPGDYEYYCSIHPSMKARLVVR